MGKVVGVFGCLATMLLLGWCGDGGLGTTTGGSRGLTLGGAVVGLFTGELEQLESEIIIKKSYGAQYLKKYNKLIH